MAASSASPVTNPKPPGSRRESVFVFTPSTSYPALGEPLPASLFGMQVVDDVIPVATSPDGSRIFTYDSTNKTIRIYTALSTEAGTGTDQSSKTCVILVQGM
jgi:hypothetical protein